MPTLIYRGPGVMVVGISPLGDGFQGSERSHLFLSTDLNHWTDITPPRSRLDDNGDYGIFQQASFLNASIGWVTSWNPATTKTTIYRTSDGGKTWTTVAGGIHSANAGAASLIDLVNPTTAFLEKLEPTGPGMSLSVTGNSGRSWTEVYSGPPPTPPNGRYQGPFEMPMTFIDPHHGFAAVGVPAYEYLLPEEGDFFYTSDGGATWRRQTPPLPSTAVDCPTNAQSNASTACLYTLPVFSDPRNGTLAAVVIRGTHARVAFDVTSDAGQRWTRVSQRQVLVTPNPSQGGVQGNARYVYPLISDASADTWWLVGWTGSSASTEITTHLGTTWKTNSSSLPPGTPTSLEAFDSTQALLTVESITAKGTTTELLSTQDGGRHWEELHLLRNSSA